MKKFLPGLLIVFFSLTAIISPSFVAAQSPAPVQNQPLNNGRTPPPEGLWVADPEVTFIGKNAARSGNLLDWTLRNYNWVCVKQAGTNAINQYQCDDSENPLAKFWLLIVSFIVVPLLFVVILATAIVIIITRGKSLTIMRFIPRFVAVIVLIVFSYSLLQFLYQFTDVIQGFFLRSDTTLICPPNCISQKDLLYVGWKYEDFVGLRLLHDYYAESAFISLLLTKLTALTYFVMVGILLMRKIILWFFIIVSPIFPLLLLYYPVRNTGKIWIGEFFRWLLYAPLFAMFLNGLVYMWRIQIPLLFIPPQGTGAVNDVNQIIYPTAVNILLGGPKQFVTPNNSVNLTETFALYVVALIMLWVVILLPWILLQIFLDYASNFSPGESAVMKTLVSLAGNKKPVAPAGGGGGIGPSPAGAAISLPFTKKFQMPTSLGPTSGGAAKEIVRESSSARSTSTFGQSTFASASQVNAQVLSVANVQLPTMRDIARYDSAQYSNDTSRVKEVSLAKETLEKIANPVAVTNTVDREKFSDIRDKLTQESAQGNLLATSILNAASSVSKTSASSNVSTSQMQSILQQIANPASTSTSSSSVVNREKMSQLHDMLSKESKQNNNQLASSLLSVSEKTSSSEIEKIKDTLMQASAQGDRTAQNVMSQISSINKQSQSTQQVKTVLQQVNNPASASSPVNREKLTKLQESLTKASKEGNDLATAVLKVTDKTSAADIEKIQQKIQQAKQKGEPIAAELANMTQTKVAAPVVNRVQTVSKEDYDAVRDMWKENYSNLEIPQGMAGSRSEWIKDDIGKIDKIVGLLSSTDKEKVDEGMDEVANILPFLLMGGFSQTEIVAYLKAKQDAGKDVVASIAADEDTKISVGTQTAHAEKTMAASFDTSSSSSSSDDESPLTSITTNTTNIITPQVSNEILAMVNLKLPKMSDVVRYETRTLTKDTTKVAEVQKMHSMLEKISNPESAAVGPERDRFVQLRAKLMEASSQGNATASVILSAAASATKSTAPSQNTTKSVLQQIAAPTTEENKKRFENLHKKLEDASKSGNQLASSILAVKDTTSVEEIEQLRSKLAEAKQKGEPIASDVLANVSETVALPSANTLQQVSKEEFDEVKSLWKENYTNLEVPQGMAGTRADWIKDDIAKIDSTVGLLTSDNPENVKKGVDEVSNILPFLLMGGYSQTEIVAYLNAKQEAAKEVLQDITTEEESKVSVSTNEQTTAVKTMSVSATDMTSTTSAPDGADIDVTTVTAPQVSNEILTLVNLQLPKIRDIARFEAAQRTGNNDQLQETAKMHDILTGIANPAAVTDASARERFEKVRAKLVEESQKGNMTADIVLTAASSSAAQADHSQASAYVKKSLQQIANPELSASPVDKERMQTMHESLVKEKEKGNQLAAALLDVQETTSVEDIEKIKTQLNEANQKGEPFAKDILAQVGGQSVLPPANIVQAVSPEEFDEVKHVWLENYKNMPIEPSFGTDVNGRLEMIKRDMTEVQGIIDLLVAKDPEKMKEGVAKVTEILPFLLLGGFSLPEMIAYLKAKYDAAKEATKVIEEEENSKVTVDAASGAEQSKEAAQEEKTK